MPLREEFESNGNWLFQRRSYLPLLLFTLIPAALINFTYPFNSHFADMIFEILCLATSFFGLAVRIATVGFVPKGTSGRNTKSQVADSLNTTGMYSIVRHPLYLGNFFMWLGVVSILQSFLFTSLVMLLFVLYYERIMYAEEEFLRNKYGATFIEWSTKTPLIWPKLSNWTPPSMPFSFKSSIKREYIGFSSILIIMLVFEIVETKIAEGSFEIDPLWLILTVVNIGVFTVVRFLKKKTTLLNEVGR